MYKKLGYTQFYEKINNHLSWIITLCIFSILTNIFMVFPSTQCFQKNLDQQIKILNSIFQTLVFIISNILFYQLETLNEPYCLHYDRREKVDQIGSIIQKQPLFFRLKPCWLQRYSEIVFTVNLCLILSQVFLNVQVYPNLTEKMSQGK